VPGSVPGRAPVAAAGGDCSASAAGGSDAEQEVTARTAAHGMVMTGVRRMATLWHVSRRPRAYGTPQQPTSFSANQRVMPSRLTRSCAMVSRSRMVTASSSSVSKSTVTQ
jgi:Mrp family chromosome partitioning ATPase